MPSETIATGLSSEWIEAETEYIMAMKSLSSYTDGIVNSDHADLIISFRLFDRAEEMRLLRENGKKYYSEEIKQYENTAEKHGIYLEYAPPTVLPDLFLQIIRTSERQGCTLFGDNFVRGAQITPNENCRSMLALLSELFPGCAVRTQNRYGDAGEKTLEVVHGEFFVFMPSETSESSLRVLQDKTRKAKKDIIYIQDELQKRHVIEQHREKTGGDGIPDLSEQAIGRVSAMFEGLNVFTNLP